jgi:UDP-2,3-diacylglucosamine pyrophosphatase LpxH
MRRWHWRRHGAGEQEEVVRSVGEKTLGRRSGNSAPLPPVPRRDRGASAGRAGRAGCQALVQAVLRMVRSPRQSGVGSCRAAERLGVRTIFISDAHLGVRGCQAETLADFLARHDAETIFLIGDIIDGWRMKPSRPWPPCHADVVSELLRKAQAGCRLVYVPGNHDDALRELAGSSVGGVEIVDCAIHQAADGRRYFVTHGDEFDWLMRARWLARLGSWTRDILRALDVCFAWARPGAGSSSSPVSVRALRMFASAITRLRRFDQRLCAEARRRHLQGIICGHVHCPADRQLSGVHYLNAGDWMDSCTGIVEHHDGRFEVVHWRQRDRLQAAPAQSRAPSLALWG